MIAICKKCIHYKSFDGIRISDRYPTFTASRYLCDCKEAHTRDFVNDLKIDFPEKINVDGKCEHFSPFIKAEDIICGTIECGTEIETCINCGNTKSRSEISCMVLAAGYHYAPNECPEWKPVEKKEPEPEKDKKALADFLTAKWEKYLRQKEDRGPKGSCEDCYAFGDILLSGFHYTLCLLKTKGRPFLVSKEDMCIDWKPKYEEVNPS